MASVYRRTYKNREGQTTECEKYTAECKIGDRFCRFPAFKDKKASEELARKIERLANLRTAGEQPDGALTRWLERLTIKLRNKLSKCGLLTGRAAASTRPVSEHLADYKQAFLDGVASPKQKRPGTRKHADLITYRVTTVLNGIGASFQSDVSAEAVGRFLAECRLQEKLSVQTSNNYVKDCKAFFNWMVRTKRATENPIACISKQQVTPRTRKHVRRILEHSEGMALLRAARQGSVCYGMTGEERYWLYRLALETGFRSAELRALKSTSFQLDQVEPIVWLPGDDTKNGKSAEQPLRPDTVTELIEFLAMRPATGPVFPMPASDEVVRMLRIDLKAADIPYDTDSGVIDFHALRGTCLSWLAAAGVTVKTLQTFARHSTPILTMNVYTHTLQGSLAAAPMHLPTLSESGPETLRATGTDSVRPNPPAAGGRTGGRTGRNGAPGVARQCAELQRGRQERYKRVHPQEPCIVGENTRIEAHRSA